MIRFLQYLEEQKLNTAVMAFGRMNPPTVGHEKLVDKVKEIAGKHNAHHEIILSHSQDSKKNPLHADDKVAHAKRAFPDTNITAASKEHPTFLQHAARLHQAGHEHLIMVAGSDRVDEYKEKLNKYNGTHPGALFNFKKITVKSAGHRDPDAEGTTGMSASKMREHAASGNKKQFMSGAPSKMSDEHKHELYKSVRRGMGLDQ